MPKKLTTNLFIEKSKQIHGDNYDYSNVVYVNCHKKVKIICNSHGEFEQRPYRHQQGDGCPVCGFEKMAQKNTKTTENFINEAVKIHGDQYDYSRVQYVDIYSHVKIVCNSHGEFIQTPKNHLRGCGCSECRITKRAITSTKTTENFINEAVKIHGDRYDYSLVQYGAYKTDVLIKCSIHGSFEQTPATHLNGSGCPDCGLIEGAANRTRTTEAFINEAVKIHGDKFDYSQAQYTKDINRVVIICKKHGSFEQTPASHLNGSGCPKCSNQVSNLETLWLNCIAVEHRQVKLNVYSKLFCVDGFDPTTNTVYEFLGDFWHGNPKRYNPEDINCVNYKQFKVLYEETCQRLDFLQQKYTVVYIWESDFVHFKKSFVALL